jgi:hypothetical protein
MSLIYSYNEKCFAKNVRKIKHILCSISFLDNHAVCEIMWKNVLEPDR